MYPTDSHEAPKNKSVSHPKQGGCNIEKVSGSAKRSSPQSIPVHQLNHTRSWRNSDSNTEIDITTAHRCVIKQAGSRRRTLKPLDNVTEIPREKLLIKIVIGTPCHDRTDGIKKSRRTDMQARRVRWPSCANKKIGVHPSANTVPVPYFNQRSHLKAGARECKVSLGLNA